MEQDNKEIYTVTIVKNYGRPFSFTIGKRRLAGLSLLLLIAAGLFLYASFDYLVLRAQNKRVGRQLELASERLSELNKQISAIDSKYFAQAENNGKTLLKDRLLNQADLSTENLWAEGQTPDLEMAEGVAVEVGDFKAAVQSDKLKLEVKLINQSTPDQSLGGYLSVTLVNEDKDPVVYKTVTGGPLGDKGFPASFKSGVDFFIKTKGSSRAVKLSLALGGADEYYTHAMVFVYSFKGSLLTRSTHRLNKGIFTEKYDLASP